MAGKKRMRTMFGRRQRLPQAPRNPRKSTTGGKRGRSIVVYGSKYRTLFRRTACVPAPEVREILDRLKEVKTHVYSCVERLVCFRYLFVEACAR